MEVISVNSAFIFSFKRILKINDLVGEYTLLVNLTSPNGALYGTPQKGIRHEMSFSCSGFTLMDPSNKRSYTRPS